MFSVVDAPARRLARRLGQDTAWALVGQALPGDLALVSVAGSELRDSVAAVPAVEAAPAPVPLGPQVQAAQSEVYAFLQASVAAAPSGPPDAGTSAAPASESADLGGKSAPAPLSLPDPLVAASLLPFLSLLILRSRLFS